MTENEIIECLKENKTKGIAYLFLPEEVSSWISEHLAEPKLLYLNSLGNWDEFNIRYLDDYDNVIFALPDNFQIKKEIPEGEWIELEIRDDGYFNSDIGLHLWFEWQKFLKFSYNHDIGFTAFGGWKYKNCKAWFMQAMLYQEDRYVTSEFEKEPFKTEPAIPIKIRFWRISK